MALLTRIAETTNADLERYGRDNPGWSFERNDDSALIVGVTQTSGGAREAEAFRQLDRHRENAGGSVYGASTGFECRPGRSTRRMPRGLETNGAPPDRRKRDANSGRFVPTS